MKSGHFKIEAKMLIWLVVAVAGLTFIVGIAVPWILHQLDVDRCLDAGGAFDYERSTCVGAKHN